MEESPTAISRALNYVKSYALPMRAGSLLQAKKLAHEGNINNLISYIVSDIGLLTSLLSELSQSNRDKKSRTLHEVLISNQDQVLSKLEKIEATSSYHSLEDASETQLSRLREALIAIGSSRALAPFCLVDEEIAFSAALVRQLGFLLVAWNYPSVYQDILESSEDGDSIDALVAAKIGFHPHTLALAILGEWGLTEALAPVVALEETPSATQSLVLSLRHLCQIGEALARANEPDLYPSAADDWEASKEEILQIAGESGLSAVRDEVRRCAKCYSDRYPLSFSSIKSFNPELAPKSLPRCKESLKRKLEHLLLDPSISARDKLRRAAKQIPLEEGFSDGGIYTLEPISDSLVRRLSIGDCKPLPTYKLEDASSIPRSYRENRVIVRGESDGHLSFAAPLEELSTVGILFLRTAGDATTADFQAINSAISICLKNSKI